MRPPKNSWPDTDGAKGALFFAQHLVELLSDDTFESFRAMTMDTLARIDEAIVISNDVMLNMVPAKVLEPVVQEIRWSLEQDPVSKSVAPREVQAFIEHTNSPKAATELCHLLTFLGKRLHPKYCAALENEILAHYADPKGRMALRRATGFYCSHLINAGFSREAILDEVETRFFSADIQRVRRERLTSFFKKFETREWRFDVFNPLTRVSANTSLVWTCRSDPHDGCLPMPAGLSFRLWRQLSPSWSIEWKPRTGSPLPPWQSNG